MVDDEDELSVFFLLIHLAQESKQAFVDERKKKANKEKEICICGWKVVGKNRLLRLKDKLVMTDWKVVRIKGGSPEGMPNFLPIDKHALRIGSSRDFFFGEWNRFKFTIKSVALATLVMQSELQNDEAE